VHDPAPSPIASTADADARLLAVLGAWEPGGVVALSGGVDSALVLDAAARAWGANQVLAATSRSASVPAAELDDAARLAAHVGVEHLVLEGRELDIDAYRANPTDRCFFCRDHLFGRLREVAAARGFPHVLDGANVDDLGDHRPGMHAARRHGVISPLLLAGLSKHWVRELARERGLTVWDKPAEPCLSSRIPYGTPVTPEALARIEHAERALKALGFPVVRVRDHAPVGRIEVPADALPRLLEEATRRRAVHALREAGFAYVALDLEGFRSGNLNR